MKEVKFTPAPPKSIEEKIKLCRQFGANMPFIFTVDNAQHAQERGAAITMEEADALKAKLLKAWDLCELGSLQLAKEALQAVKTDAIFTEERKQKYIDLITDFLKTL